MGSKFCAPGTRAKIAKSLRGNTNRRGKPTSLETREKLRAANLGKHHSTETREKERNAQLERWHSPHARSEWSKKMRTRVRRGENHPFYGKHLSAETKKKLSEMRRGSSNPYYGKRHSAETLTKMSAAHRGEKHWAWRGGTSLAPYSTDWTKTLRRSMRERDHYACRLCGRQQEDRAFPVHHIDYDRLNCNSTNLITLCASCHSRTNRNRERWTALFREMTGSNQPTSNGGNDE
jgi:hypothetical protein